MPSTKHNSGLAPRAIFLATALGMLIVDIVSKRMAAAALGSDEGSLNFGLVSFVLVHNKGAAFGIAQNMTVFFIICALVVVAGICVYVFLSRRHTVFECLALGLIVAGGIGNLLDRLTTVYVLDFIKLTFIDFPVFNVADMCVTCGTVCFFISLFRGVCFSSSDSGGTQSFEQTKDDQ